MVGIVKPSKRASAYWDRHPWWLAPYGRCDKTVWVVGRMYGDHEPDRGCCWAARLRDWGAPLERWEPRTYEAQWSV